MKKHIHFIGIGGIGVSALAKYYLKKGWEVSGSDLTASEITQQMKELGAQVHIGKPKASLITKKTQKVIFSPAVQKDHEERVDARKRNIQELSYPEALGELTKEYYTIAVSGTHGKSTTTAMLGLLLIKAGLNPTVIVGTKLKEFNNSNCRVGGYPDTKYKILNTKYLVIEADEHFASFLNYRPQIIILTSLEADHLDFYKTLANLKKTFTRYISLMPKDGIIIANKDDKNIKAILRGQKRTIKWYSVSHKSAGLLAKLLKIPGKHNVSNALAALTAARLLKVPDATSYKALSSFLGSWRRFEVFTLRQAQGKPYTLVSDYGHHPTEIAATLQGARENGQKRISGWCINPINIKEHSICSKIL